jgi:hypothetical protein
MREMWLDLLEILEAIQREDYDRLRTEVQAGLK